MYLGKLVETGPEASLYDTPRHPYTKALLSAVPVPEPAARGERQRILLPGDPPSPVDPPSGCRFRTRCWQATETCSTTEPPLAAGAHPVACHYPLAA
jgi:oligopeptide/dipeptide ABC transporter ATP-binding protein